MEDEYLKKRGAQSNPSNRFDPQRYSIEHWEGIDEYVQLNPDTRTQYIEVFPKTILNKVPSPDIPMDWSMNPYQGCEHGCVYCYARNTHEYWGYSAGLDFESKILVKKNAAELLDKALRSPKWKATPVMLSGNTDCYQPIEWKEKITRRILEVFLKWKHPVGIITKNNLVLRDMDILKELAKDKLVSVVISINSLSLDTQQKLEPRTATPSARLRTIKRLSDNGIPVTALLAPMIPGINSGELIDLVKAVAENGVQNAGYILVRLNGKVGEIFKDWLLKNFPDRYNKVIHQIESFHGGKVSDSRFKTRMRGEGQFAELMNKTFKVAMRKYMKEKPKHEFNLSLFRNDRGEQMEMFS